MSLSGINVRNMNGAQDVSSLLPIRVSIVLAKEAVNTTALVVASAFATLSSSDWSYPSILSSLGALSPASDFRWNLMLVQPAITDVVITLSDVAVSVLDVSPIIQAFSSPNVSFTGSNITFDCVPMSPATEFFVPLFTASNVTNASCKFLPSTSGLSSFAQPAHFVSIAKSLIQLR